MNYVYVVVQVFVFYLSVRQKGGSDLLHAATGLHRFLKLTSDVIMAWTRNPLVGNTDRECCYTDLSFNDAN